VAAVGAAALGALDATAAVGTALAVVVGSLVGESVGDRVGDVVGAVVGGAVHVSHPPLLQL
jgi:hypothetical protein